MNFSLNGYARPTTPELAKLPVLSFTDVSSCGTATAASLPCMFSPLGREAFDARASTENLLDVLQRAGLAVLWLDNQAGCKGLCERIPNAFTHQLPPAPAPCPPACAMARCFDEALLHALDKRIAALDPERVKRGVVLVLHQMGSHGPAYYKRSPPDLKPFQPECRSNALQRCAREEVINGYDNTIATTDRMLARAVTWLQGQQKRSSPGMYYVSDHGESLGEKGLPARHALRHGPARADARAHDPLDPADRSCGLPHGQAPAADLARPHLPHRDGLGRCTRRRLQG